MDIEAVEKIFDDRYASTRFASRNKDKSKWLLLTFSEDYILILWNMSKSLHRVSVMADSQKYSIKFGLARIESELVSQSVDLQVIITKAEYNDSKAFLEAGEEFTAANRICLLVHAGLYSYRFADSVFELAATQYWGVAGYSALEMTPLERTDREFFFEFVMSSLGRPPKTKFYDSLKDQCQVSDIGIITYEFSSALCLSLADKVPPFKQSIPDDWIFPWGSGAVAKKLLWALMIRCFFHLLTIRKAAHFYSVNGGGLESLCLLTDEATLSLELAKISMLEVTDALSFVRALSLGEATRANDPALQPFIKLSDGRLLIGCLNVLTNKQDRNLLSLHARVSKGSFDSQSSIFEKLMIQRIEDVAKARKFNYKKNYHIPGAREVGDLDVIFCDARSKTLLICELRWILQPGDAREVMLKAKACNDKVPKIALKAVKAKEKIEDLLARFDVKQAAPNEWAVCGLVVIEGYAGIKSCDDAYPIIPMGIFLEGLNIFTRLDRLYAWAKSLKWLPQENKHFTSETVSTDLGEFKVNRPGFANMTLARPLLSHVKESAKKMK
ncbi:MAG: hypothetical protein JWQ03_3145 [Variovorax sp.]|nr:hypothetical protein [Variovorax sp.]